VVPDQTTWYSAFASQMGAGTNDVLYNVRQKARLQPRVFLIDPMLKMGLPSAAGLPYSQTNFVLSTAPCPMLPVSPRIMIVSSLGKALPAAVVSGVFTSGHPEYFSNLWSAADGTVPTDAAWSGWTGKGGDVVVQRINLASLFVHLFLQKYPASTNASFSIDGGAPTNVPTLNGIDGYFIQGSVLYLYTNSPLGQDTRQILARSSSFLFDNGVWRGSLSGAVMGSGVMNLGDVVQQFLNATPNVNAQNPGGNAQQKLVVNNMLNYMSNYNVWAVQFNYNNNGLKTYLTTLQGTMMSSLQGLYNGANFPTNPTACLQ
jgi:hypothetical protein